MTALGVDDLTFELIGEAKWPAANLKACRGPDRRIGAFAVARGADGRRDAHAARRMTAPVLLSH